MSGHDFGGIWEASWKRQYPKGGLQQEKDKTQAKSGGAWSGVEWGEPSVKGPQVKKGFGQQTGP